MWDFLRVVIGRCVIYIQYVKIRTYLGSKQFAITFYRKMYQDETAMWQNI